MPFVRIPDDVVPGANRSTYLRIKKGETVTGTVESYNGKKELKLKEHDKPLRVNKYLKAKLDYARREFEDIIGKRVEVTRKEDNNKSIKTCEYDVAIDPD